MKKFFALFIVLTMLVGVSIGSYADSAPGWLLNKNYEEGDYVKFRGMIYISTDDHTSDKTNYPGAGDEWTAYKRGAGFKKGQEPSLDRPYKWNGDKDDDRNDNEPTLKPIYTEDGIKVYLQLDDFDEDGYEGKITLYNSTDRHVDDWALSFEFNEGEEIKDVDDDVDFDQDEDEVTFTPEEDEDKLEAGKKVSFEFKVEADLEDLFDDEDEDDDDEDIDIDMPNRFDLDITWGDKVVDSAETGAILVKIEEPDFDDDLFTPEVEIDGEDKDIDWGKEALFTDLEAGKSYVIKAETFETDTHIYKPEIDDEKVTVKEDALVVVTISYEEIEKDDYETGRVLVYVLKPDFDEDLFTPEVTIDGEEKEIDWGKYVYFEGLEVGETFDVIAEDVEIDGVDYEVTLSTDEVKIYKNRLTYVLVKYEED